MDRPSVPANRRILTLVLQSPRTVRGHSQVSAGLDAELAIGAGQVIAAEPALPRVKGFEHVDQLLEQPESASALASSPQVRRALPIARGTRHEPARARDRKSTRLNSSHAN